MHAVFRIDFNRAGGKNKNIIMANEKKSLKSSFDLAMERLSQHGGQSVSLTNEQKKSIAEVEQKTRAKIAELEIMFRSRIIEAQDDEEKIEKLTNQHQMEMAKIREKAEEEKERIR